MAASPAEQTGLVVASHGRHCTVEIGSTRRVRCHPRGKKLDAVVGDHVQWQPAGDDEGVITGIAARRNLLHRQDAGRSKAFAANVDQVLVLLAAEPAFPERLLARILVACEAAGIGAFVGLNKRDLQAPFAVAWERLAPYRSMGYHCQPLAVGAADQANDAPVQALARQLAGRITLLIGPSGTGKSTLVNRLIPAAAARTGSVSRALRAGRHTTTSTSLHWLPGAPGGALIDSPGFQEFGLHHLQPAGLAGYLPDLRQHASSCRFLDCTHRSEPDCAVRAAVEAGAIDAGRYRFYLDLHAELQPAPY